VGLAADLDYRIAAPNVLQRGVRLAASSRVGSRVLARLLPPLDRAVARLSRGRTTAVELLAGLPVIEVTTTGRRSGRTRRTQLIAIPVADTLALLGTNFGQASTPTWALNLEADPTAVLTHKHRRVEVVARPADDGERATVLDRAGQVYLGYPKYLGRISGRTVRIFILTPTASVSTTGP
jgi:deazaflavin-dependent oxidoreductase (nitroreductase family)